MEEERLPDTLTPKDMVTLATSQPNLAEILPWGRLIACKRFLQSVDLVGVDRGWTFGRSEASSVIVPKIKDCPRDLLENISKTHFEIHKDSDNHIVVTDLSKNGTFINRVRLGFGNKKILKNDDLIAVVLADKSIYVFRTFQSSEEFLPEVLIPKYANIRRLGRGSCGEVRLVTDRDTFKNYAVKKILLGLSNSSQINKINHPSKIAREIQILRSLSHPCVIMCEDIIQCNKEIYLILEYMAGGELTNRIIDSPMTEDCAKFYFLQLLYAVQYLHSNGVIHRDLKPENILLLDRGYETILKITDFGLSEITNASDMTTMCGTMRFVAPEVLSKKFREYGEYGKKVDVWSLGVILYFMVSRTYPFHGENHVDMADNIIKGAFDITSGIWSVLSTELKDLLKNILVVAPKKRFSIFQIIYHTWIKNDHGVKFRVDNLLQQKGLENPLQDLLLEPPEKKFKFGNSPQSSLSESGDLNATLVYSDGGSGYSSEDTMCF